MSWISFAGHLHRLDSVAYYFEKRDFMNNIKLVEDSRQLLDKVSQYIDTARTNISTSVNFEMVKAYWLIGREIVEEEQQGNQRAEYGEIGRAHV